jgi:hypothetical protein
VRHNKLDIAAILFLAALVGYAVAILIAAFTLGACQFAKDVGGEVGGTVAGAIACPTDLIDCGHVYMCAAEADNALGHIEICIDDDDHPEDVDAAELMYGRCEPTPRHQGLCRWCSGPDCGRGCNAFSGCYAPP